MLGVLDLGALNRRLSLDFSDLFGPGYAFERINGKLAIRKGRADIVDMTIEGPSAEIRIEGKTDLIKQEFDQVDSGSGNQGFDTHIADLSNDMIETETDRQ